MCLLAVCAYGQAPIIDSFHSDGVLTCSRIVAGSTCSVEWASSPGGPWTNWTAAAAFDEIIVNSNGTINVAVPMFYRVKATLPRDDYLLVDLSAGPSASIYPVASLSSAPSGGWTDEHKTTKMVFRPIPAGTFTMGSPTNEFGHLSDETQHEVPQNGDTTVATAKVGSYEVPQWGLYDIHGNVLEWYLDWYGTYPDTVSDPRGETSGSGPCVTRRLLGQQRLRLPGCLSQPQLPARRQRLHRLPGLFTPGQ